MRVFYDHQIFTEQKHGGISRYFFELMNRFKSKEDKLISSTIVSNNEYLRYLQNSKSIPFFPNNQFRGKARVMNLINRMNTERLLKRGDYDVFHPTFYDSYFLKFLGNKPFVLTVYDLINEKFNSQFEYLKLEDEIIKSKRLLMKHASKIIAISESTKTDIINYYQIDKNKIEVIYLGNSLLKHVGNQKAMFQFDYVLFVGNRTMYKNFIFTVQSVHQLLKQYDLKFVCFGGGQFSQNEIDVINKLGLQNLVIQIGQHDDQTLENLYSNALFFIFPSMYEGFGLPLLEAFGCKCPVLSSTGGSLKEIAGDAAIYFDPSDSQSLHKSFSEMLDSTDLRDQYIKRGTERVSLYSWDKTYLETQHVYKAII